MGRRTLADLKRNPKNATTEDLASILEAYGWEVRGGTLHGFVAVHRVTGRTFPFPRPHDKHLLPVYVRSAIKLIEEEAK